MFGKRSLTFGKCLVVVGIVLMGVAGWGLCHGGPAFIWPICLFPVTFLSLGVALLFLPLVLPGRSRKLRIIGLSCVALVAAVGLSVCLGIRRYDLVHFAAFERSARNVDVGLTKVQIAKMFGKPHMTRSVDKVDNVTPPGAKEIWTYNGFGVFQYVNIYFDADGKTTGSHYDY